MNNESPQYAAGGGWGSKLKTWLKDSSSIIVAIVIILILAVSIFIYSRDKSPVLNNQPANQNQEEDNSLTVIPPVEEPESIEPIEEKKENSEPVADNPVPVQELQEFQETAGKGEGVTHLARRALTAYLSQNPVPSLTKEHKIYIEDYLAKRVGANFLEVGETRTFPTTMMIDAISKSQELTPPELQNLTQYANLVPSL